MNVRLSGLSKRFGSVVACDDVSLSLRAGEVCALLGENGAGKSTLMKMLYGLLAPDRGQIAVDQSPVRLRSPREARALGIGMLPQQLSLIDALSVEENLLCGSAAAPLWLSRSAKRRARAALSALAPDIDPARRAGDLSPGEKQLCELSKLLAGGARLLILDEPTSLLARPEAERLWLALRELARAGHAVVLITHKLEDVAACASRVVVLRAGRVVLEADATEAPDRLVSAMLGGELVRRRTRRSTAERVPRLELRDVCAEGADQRLEHVSFSVGRGEVLGVAGVTGNGQELLGRVLAGIVSAARGRVELDGQHLSGPADARVAYVSEQPALTGIAASLSLLANLEVLGLRRMPWWLSRELEARRAAAKPRLERFDVRPRELDRPAGTLSGGNVQKLVLARELCGAPLLVVACFPAMGLDAAACERLYGELAAHAERGAAVVWIGEDLDALLAHADRIAVLCRGRLRGPVPAAGADRRLLGAWMTGGAAPGAVTTGALA